MSNRDNYVRLIGNLGADPEITRTSGGASVVSFDVATGGRKYTADGGEEKTARTNWSRIKIWNNAAERAHERLEKGSRVLVEGQLVNDSYEDEDGVARYTSHVKASFFEVILVQTKD